MAEHTFFSHSVLHIFLLQVLRVRCCPRPLTSDPGEPLPGWARMDHWSDLVYGSSMCYPPPHEPPFSVSKFIHTVWVKPLHLKNRKESCTITSIWLMTHPKWKNSICYILWKLYTSKKVLYICCYLGWHGCRGWQDKFSVGMKELQTKPQNFQAERGHGFGETKARKKQNRNAARLSGGWGQASVMSAKNTIEETLFLLRCRPSRKHKAIA